MNISSSATVCDPKKSPSHTIHKHVSNMFCSDAALSWSGLIQKNLFCTAPEPPSLPDPNQRAAVEPQITLWMWTWSIHLQVFKVQVRLVYVWWLVSSVAVFNHWIQQVLEHLVRLLVSSDASYRHDERVTCRDTKWTISSGPEPPSGLVTKVHILVLKCLEQMLLTKLSWIWCGGWIRWLKINIPPPSLPVGELKSRN